MIKNNRGFTLVELLATIVVIGVLILITVPNMMGILNKNKDSNYINDAVRMKSLAEYRFRTEDKDKINKGEVSCISYTLKELNKNQNFDNTPDSDDTKSNQKAYNENKSFVVVKKVGAEYKYYVFLTTIDRSKEYANFDSNYNLITSGEDDSKNYKLVEFDVERNKVCPD